MNEDSEKELTDEEIAKRRDEVVRRMLNTPPKPKEKAKDDAPKPGIKRKR